MTIPEGPATPSPVRGDAGQQPPSPPSGDADGPDRAETLRVAERIARLASNALHAPMASIAVAEGAGLYVRSCVGFPKDRTPRPGSPFLCPLSRHVFTSGAPLAIPDVPSHPLGSGHAGLAALGVRAYLGFPLRNAAGATLGMLSVFAQEARDWSASDEAVLRDLAAVAVEQSELRTATRSGASTTGANGDHEGPGIARNGRSPAPGRGTLLDEGTATARKMDALARLSAALSHDFNNHLTAIKGFSQIARRSLDALSADANVGSTTTPEVIPPETLDQLRGDIDEITAAAERASALTARLAAVGGRLPQHTLTFDLNERLASLEAGVRALVDPRVEVRLDLAVAPALVEADPLHVEQLLGVLVLNARDAMPEGGRLTIETATVTGGSAGWPTADRLAPGTYVVLTVSDSGVGMDAETRAHLFEPYFTTKDVAQGSGLGLASVYGIVRQSRGDVTVESAPGQGTTVRVFFPAAEPPRNGARQRRESNANLRAADDDATRREATVLVVEDEPAVRQLACTMLRRLGHRVVPAANSAEALRLLAALADDGIVPDLLVTDVVMPGMGGPELAEEIARRHARVAVLYMSGYSDDMVERRGELGAGTAFLEKPFTLEQFTASVAGLLRHTS